MQSGGSLWLQPPLSSPLGCQMLVHATLLWAQQQQVSLVHQGWEHRVQMLQRTASVWVQVPTAAAASLCSWGRCRCGCRRRSSSSAGSLAPSSLGTACRVPPAGLAVPPSQEQQQHCSPWHSLAAPLLLQLLGWGPQ